MGDGLSLEVQAQPGQHNETPSQNKIKQKKIKTNRNKNKLKTYYIMFYGNN